MHGRRISSVAILQRRGAPRSTARTGALLYRQIEPRIRDVARALHANGFVTSMSCGGHRGYSYWDWPFIPDEGLRESIVEATTGRPWILIAGGRLVEVLRAVRVLPVPGRIRQAYILHLDWRPGTRLPDGRIRPNLWAETRSKIWTLLVLERPASKGGRR